MKECSVKPSNQKKHRSYLVRCKRVIAELSIGCISFTICAWCMHVYMAMTNGYETNSFPWSKVAQDLTLASVCCIVALCLFLVIIRVTKCGERWTTRKRCQAKERGRRSLIEWFQVSTKSKKKVSGGLCRKLRRGKRIMMLWVSTIKCNSRHLLQ